MVEVQNGTGSRLPCPHRDIAGWAAAAWRSSKLREEGSSLCIRLVDRAEGRRLNVRFANKDAPTNVLAFDGDGVDHMGDLAICLAVARAEARAQHKTVRNHLAHLVVHGALHLQGYDHRTESEARRMESREVEVLEELGIRNPYRADVRS